MGSYIPNTEKERKEMLASIGMTTARELYGMVPEQVFLDEVNLPEGLSEMEAGEKLSEYAAANHVFTKVFRGAGAYRHYIPSIVKTVTSKEEFLTAYTPYQAEISQGVLQSIFEYQTQICELTGMDVSNASVYDGASAAAEAMFMCQERKRKEILVSGAVNPEILKVLDTYAERREVPVRVIPPRDLATDVEAMKEAIGEGTAAVLIQNPNYYGVLEDVEAITEAAHAAGAKVILSVNPISLGILKTPGEYGVDVCVAEGQPLGLPLSFGGPYLGIMATTAKMIRNLPGRIVGETTDAEGRRAFVLTLQAREQHIRREKASSNICSNEALCAMTASVYLAAMGPEGLRRAAVNSASHAHYLAGQLEKLGFHLVSDRSFFHEFVTTCPGDPEALMERLEAHGILGGLPIPEGILWCCTELNTKAQIDELIDVLRKEEDAR